MAHTVVGKAVPVQPQWRAICKSSGRVTDKVGKVFFVFFCFFVLCFDVVPFVGDPENAGVMQHFRPRHLSPTMPTPTIVPPTMPPVFAVVCATSKKNQTAMGAQVSAIRGLMNVMCTHLLHTKRHVIVGRWEESLGVEVGSSPIKDSRMKFLHTLIEDVQMPFNEFEWASGVPVESWVETSSCSCDRVFSYVTAADYDHNTECMRETLWVRCNGEAPEDWGPFEVFDDLRKTPFRPQGFL